VLLKTNPDILGAVEGVAVSIGGALRWQKKAKQTIKC
jgi:hypothetical protein